MEPDTADRLATSMPWLDSAADTLLAATEPILGEDAPRALKDALYGVWLGHPLHPAVVALPVGCWTASAVFDLMGEERAADLTIDVGLASAGLAAVSGAAQWRDATNDEGPRRLGALHALLNTAGTACYLGSSIARRNGNRTGGLALSTLGLAITMVSGWVGGELAYEMGVGVDRNAFQSPPDDWTDVLADGDLPANTPVRVNAGDTPVMLYRDEHGIHAIGATCSHYGGPLDKGTIEDDCVQCPWHGSVFRLRDGAVVHGPATSPQPRFEVQSRGGRLLVRPMKPEPMEMPSAPAVSVSVPDAIPAAMEAAREAADRVVSVLPGQGGEPRQDQAAEQGSVPLAGAAGEGGAGYGIRAATPSDAPPSFAPPAGGAMGAAAGSAAPAEGRRTQPAGAATDAVTGERPAGTGRSPEGGEGDRGGTDRPAGAMAGDARSGAQVDASAAGASVEGEALFVAGADVPAPPTATAPNADSVPGDGTKECPPGYPIKGNADSGIYHKPNQGSYDRTIPEYCFASPEAAEAAGFRPVGGH